MSSESAVTTGPVQLLVVGFEGDAFDGSIVAELDRLSDQGIVRLVDMLLVRKDEQGNIAALEGGPAGPAGGKHVGALIGLAEGGTQPPGDPAPPASETAGHEVWFVADSIPEGSPAAIVLIEHLWAAPLREATEKASGDVLDEAWVHPLDLAAIGLSR